MGTFRFRGLLLTALAAATLIAAGCSESPNTPTNPEINQQQAAQIASQLAASMALNGGWAMTELNTAAASVPTNAPSTFSTSAEEVSFSEGEINFSFSFEFFNAMDEPLSQWDSTAVKMVATTRVWGVIDHPEVVATLGHGAELVFTGIEPSSEIITLNGTARDTMNADFTNPDSSGVRYLAWLAGLTYDDVMMSKDTTVSRYPLSGTATYHILASAAFVGPEGEVEMAYSATAVIIFNGTQYPEIVIDGKHHYIANLETGEVIAA